MAMKHTILNVFQIKKKPLQWKECRFKSYKQTKQNDRNEKSLLTDDIKMFMVMLLLSDTLVVIIRILLL